MQGIIVFLKEFGKNRFWGYVEANGRQHHFDQADIISGRDRIKVGVQVDVDPISFSNSHVTLRAEHVIVLPLEASDVF